MSIYARPAIIGQPIAEIFEPPAGFSIAQCFTPALVAEFVDITVYSPPPQVGWITTSGPPWVFAPPSAPDPLPQAQAAASLSAQAYYNSLMTPPNGFTWQTVLYAIDMADITAEGALALAAIAQPTLAPWAGTGWLSMNGVGQSFTPESFIQFATAVGNYVKNCFLILQSILATIAAATTLAQIEAINVTTGYPTPNGP